MLNNKEYLVFFDLLRGKSPDTFADIDQNKLFEIFRRHRLLSILSDESINLLEHGIAVIWHEAIRHHTLRSLQLTGVLEELIGKVNDVKLSVFSIKGPVLSQRLFGDIGKRHYNDIDLVVKREELSDVVELLEGMGYKMAHPSKVLDRAQWDYYFKYKKDVALINRKSEVVIELHVEIFRQELIRAPEETLTWDALVDETIGTLPLKCLDLNISFLYLLYHGGQHQYFRLFWLKDIAEALDRWDLDHSRILEKSADMGVDRLLGLGLLLSEEIFGSKIPPEYADYLMRNRSVLLKLKKICHRRITGSERESRSMKIRRYRFVFLLQPGPQYFVSILTNIFHRWYIRKRLGGF